MTFTTPEDQVAGLLAEHGNMAEVLERAQASLAFHKVHKNAVSTQFWTQVISMLNQQQIQKAA